MVSLTPTNSWLAGTATVNVEQASDIAVRAAWVAGVESNAARSRGALRVDGLLYSTHGLFALNPVTSQTAGAMVLNGALVAADTGLLMPGSDGLSIHYDERLRPLMDLKKDKLLVQQRVDYRLLNVDETLTYEGLMP